VESRRWYHPESIVSLAARRAPGDARAMTMRLGSLAVAMCLMTACSAPPGGGDDDAGVPPDDAGVRPDATGTGGDGGPSQLGVYESGSRLKMRVGTSPDGAKTFLGWRDTMRNEDCGFLPAADGQQRCLPSAAATYAEDLFWGDAGCSTTRLAYTTAGCAASGYVHRYVTTCVPYRLRIHVLGARHTGAVYVKSGATCTLNSTPYDFYVVGAEVPASSFVAVAESLE
jgi:hypothetical protein